MRCEPAFLTTERNTGWKLGVWIEIGEISCERAKNVDPSGPCVGVFDLRFFLRPSENNGGRQGPLVTARVRKTRESQ